MSRLRRLLLLAAAVVLAAALAWPRARLTPPAEPYGPAPGATDATGDGTPPGPTGGAGDVAPRTEERTPPERALAALDPKDAWRGRMARALRPAVAERLGRLPSPAEEQRLMDALASIGPAARTLDEESVDPDDPTSIARVREQTGVLVAADQTCRDLLGIGAAELLRRLDPSGIEDQGGSTDP